MPPLFFAKFSEILRKIRNFPANYRQITSKLKYNYLIYSKIKFLFFLLKSVAIIKKSGIFAMSNNNNNNNKNKAIMKNTAATRLASVLNKAEKMGFNRIDTLNLINEYYIKGQDIECMVLKMNGGKFSAKFFVDVLYA